LRPALWRHPRFGGVDRDTAIRYRREEDMERGARPRRALDPHLTAALLDDAVDRRQPESRPATRLLRRKERLEDARLRGGIHAHAGIANDQSDKRLAHDPRLDAQHTSGRHRVTRVDREIEQHLLDLP